jgi:peptidoglycan DL-endopeptidase CwlO
MLSSDPDEYLDKASTLDRINSRQSARLHELREARRELAQKRGEAERKLAELDATRAELASRKRVVRQKLAAARRLVESLSQRQRERLASRLDEHASRAGRDLGLPARRIGPASPRASTAVTAARGAVGRPYAWGSAGPSAFDCSGLMVWAYRQAGVALPRTSQEQAYAGRRIPLDQARPGDLVIYRGDASHVGMYVGDGQVVHAPYPGALVRYDPVSMLPVSAVTRPA